MNKIKKWKVGETENLDEFLGRLTFLDAAEVVLQKTETLRILERCSDPTEPKSARSVLVVGEVQSGKTLSFTSLISVARDAGYKLTVLLAGTKLNLRDQTFGRLVVDLQATNSGGASIWEVHKGVNAGVKNAIREALSTWSDDSIPFAYRKSTVIVGMKTAAGITKINELLTDLQEKFGESLPILFIDDEADQASLNTAVLKSDVSSTYAAVTNLRASVNVHSYVMYTATSQALLLLEFADHLSPDSVVVLESRPSYVGGWELFENPSSKFPQVIPDSEIITATNPAASDSPPRSLMESLSYFAIALTVAQKRQNPKPISMLVHPASTKQTHESYRIWITSIKKRWEFQLAGEDALQTFEFDFKKAYSEISRTVDVEGIFGNIEDNPDQKGNFLKELRYWLTNCEVRVVNSEAQINQIKADEWQSKPGWIVIGGAKLERGFTIENLAVTYMPRGVGIGAADTIQQRGRFFGHKRKYLDLLRGWINADTRRAFASIVETEKQMRNSLIKVQNDEKPLRSWRREFLLGPGMQATRRSVVSLGTNRLSLREGFQFKQSYLYHPGLGSDFEYAYDLIKSYLANASDSALDTRKTSERHKVASINLEQLKSILVNWPVSAAEKSIRDFLVVAVGFYADSNPHLNAHLYFMNGLVSRVRGLNPADASNPDEREWRISNLHQGRDPNGGYAGDNSIRTLDAISVQIHRIQPRNNLRVYPETLAIAVSWPSGFEKIVLLQD